MSNALPRWAIGLMSGTSLDGIAAALIKSDGRARVEFGPSSTGPYDAGFRADLRGLQGGAGPVAEVERELTLRQARAVEALLAGMASWVPNGTPGGACPMRKASRFTPRVPRMPFQPIK